MAVEKPLDIPESPGVYFFMRGETVLYIGKAANLKKRLSSYFRKNTILKIAQLRREATAVMWRETTGEIEALIEEARLIKMHIPKYNVLLRDDKNYAYVGITKEQFPRIFITHQPLTPNAYRLMPAYIGPFTSAAMLRGVLRSLRKIFPYCTCARPHRGPCVNAHIDRCPGYCCNRLSTPTDADRKKYREALSGLKRILRGRGKPFLAVLRRKMRKASGAQNFEEAGVLRDQIAGIENILRHRGVLEAAPAAKETRRHLDRALMQIFGRASAIVRAEAYDISNISGTAATGSMVVFNYGAPAKAAYRMFNIHTVHQQSDVDMMKEVFRRRMAHTEWPYPDLIVIDGGKPQLNAVLPIIAASRFSGVVTALAKREEELYVAGKRLPIRLDTLPLPVMHFFQHIRDEAHRFAKKQHHRLRRKSYATE
ncbi:MAG: UvrB/UvrC motif-containing protein [Patescibacteria group bacterium]